MDDAIESALSMSEEEQRERMGRMTDAVERYTVKDWADEQLAGFPQPVAPCPWADVCSAAFWLCS